MLRPFLLVSVCCISWILVVSDAVSFSWMCTEWLSLSIQPLGGLCQNRFRCSSSLWFCRSFTCMVKSSIFFMGDVESRWSTNLENPEKIRRITCCGKVTKHCVPLWMKGLTFYEDFNVCVIGHFSQEFITKCCLWWIVYILCSESIHSR